MKQTAVEWLVEQVNSDCLNSTFIRQDVIEQAKAMEKEQIIEAYSNGVCNEDITSGQYYNETFKSK